MSRARTTDETAVSAGWYMTMVSMSSAPRVTLCGAYACQSTVSKSVRMQM